MLALELGSIVLNGLQEFLLVFLLSLCLKLENSEFKIRDQRLILWEMSVTDRQSTFICLPRQLDLSHVLEGNTQVVISCYVVTHNGCVLVTRD